MEVGILFSNIQDLLSVNTILLNCLNERQALGPLIDSVGDLIAEGARSFTPYTEYCAKFGYAMKFYKNLMSKPDVGNVIEKWKLRSECRGLNLEAFLVTMVSPSSFFIKSCILQRT